MIDAKKVGERIAALRKERGLTGEQFAELLQVSAQAVSKWENGKNLPGTALLPDISELLGTSIDDMLMPRAYSVRCHKGGRYIDGVSPLQFGVGKDCTWAGAYQILLRAMGVKADYAEIMGFSGACYYLAMTRDWCPSAAMPQILYDPTSLAEQAFGVSGAYFMTEERDLRVRESIDRGLPVMLIEPRVEMEWGVLCGYTSDGNFYGRSYFDYLRPDERDCFTNNYYYLADSYPGADPERIYFLQERTMMLPRHKALKASLKTAQRLYKADTRGNGQYVFGTAAYDVLIRGLRCEDEAFAAISSYGTTENGILLLSRLIDARKAAAMFWMMQLKYISDRNVSLIRDLIGLYQQMVGALEALLPEELLRNALNGYPVRAWTKEFRRGLADALSECKRWEIQVLKKIESVLKQW